MKPRRKTLILFATLGSMIQNLMVSGASVNGPGPRLSVLYDRHGQSPCTLEERVKSDCPPQSDVSESGQDVGNCTCNVVFFNLWSACLMSNGSSVLPTFDQWIQSCSTTSQDVNNPPFPDIDIRNLPPWANMAKPNPTNTTFDVGTAIMIALVSEGRPWTTVQIITPFLSAVATVAILGFWYLYQRHTRQSDFGGRPPLFRRAHKVKETRRGEAWTIDLSENLDDTRAGKKSTQSYNLSESTLAGTGHRRDPSAWKNELPQILNFGRPAVVRNVAPGKGWRISSLDDAIESPDFLALSPQPVVHAPNLEIEGEDAELNGARAEVAGDDDQETDHLISPSERSGNSVFLISRRPGEDFTIESSPTASRLGQTSPLIAPRGTPGSSERSPIDPSQGRSEIALSLPFQSPSRSANEASNGSSIPKPFSFFPKFKISKPSEVSRNHSDEANIPPPRTITLSPPPFQVPDLLPLALIPSLSSRSARLGHEEILPYPSFHRHQRTSSSQPFREDGNSLTNGQPPLSRASPHHRTASHDV
ncbi:hypothetical protein F5887DRAFT_1030187 [Amanita rubescens]|nr:hypothetical protein F5887DRAFT_1037789 [Amanita rubescens]KAF8321516.1 hypothetical protein F5887DRAFT_1030187 [Amanita rubescens]